MAADDAKLIAVIEANTKQFENALKRIEKTTNAAFKGGASNVIRLDRGMAQATVTASRLDRVLAQTSVNTQRLAGHISTFGKGLAAGILGGIGITAITSFGGAIRKTRDALAQFDEISKSARLTGLTPEFFQALSFGAIEAGISQEKLNTALLFFAKNAGLASHGTGPLAAGLRKLNPELLKSINLATTQEERLRLVAEAMKAAGSATERAALTTTAFGRGAVDISEILAGGAAGLDDFIRRAEKLGFIIDRELLASSDKLDDQLSVLAKVIDLNLSQAMVHLAGPLIAAAEGIAKFTKALKELAEFAANPDLKTFLTTEIGGGMLAGNEAQADAIVKFVNNLKGAVTTLEEAEEHLNEMIHDVQTFPEMKRFVNEKEFQRLLLLKTLLAKGTPDAARIAIKVLKQLADEDFHFIELANKFLPVIEGLLGIKEGADDAKDAVAALTASDRARTAGGEAVKTQAFIEAQKIEAAKTDFQQELERETDDVIKAAEALGVALTRAAAEVVAADIIRIRTSVDSLDKAVGDFVSDVVQAEAPQGGPNLAGASSAFGVGQFIESTWLSLFKRHFPDRAKGMSDPAILALRADRAASEALIEAYARENAAVLQKAGVSVNAAALQLSHFLGAGDAAKVLSAASGTPLQGLISSKSIAANPGQLGGGKTVDDVLRYAQSRVGGSNSVAAQEMKDAAEAAEVAADATLKLKESKEAIIDSVNREIEALGIEARSFGQSTFAAEKAAQVFDLTNQFIAAGHEITPQLTKDIDAWAASLANAAEQAEVADENNRLFNESQDAIADKAIAQADAIRDLSSDVIGGLAHDLANGVKPAEALANALQKVAEKLLDIGLNALTSSLFGPQGTPLSGLLGSLFGGPAISSQAMAAITGGVSGGLFHEGGVVGAGGPSRMVPASSFVGAPRYHSGGVAGFRPGELPAILQKGELVIPKLMASKGGMGGMGGQQRGAVDNLIIIEPSPLFDVKMESRARQAEDRAVTRAPEYMADQKRRVTRRG